MINNSRRITYLTLSVIIAVGFALTICDTAVASGFDDASFWSTFDAGDHGVGTDPDGYYYGTFDGRYVYFVPIYNGSDHHGEVLRYDTRGDFTETSSWITFDPGEHGVGTDPDGYYGAGFDGRYIYFVPYYNGSEHHGEVLRYDTTGDFNEASSWITFDPGEHGVGTDPDGYRGDVFDGRYVYFVPYHNGSEHHGEVLRYDTTGDFVETSSWITFDPGEHGVGTDPDGYVSAVFDGQYAYFVPYHNGSNCHGEVLRYDTSGDFNEASSWITFDAGEYGVGTDPDGYYYGTFDGRYVYFVPYYNGNDYHGEVLRYDTTGDFNEASSWITFDAGEYGVGTDPDGYYGAVFDGRYVYFVPHNNGNDYHGEVLRYDTNGDFNETSSWSTFDAGGNGVGTDPDGYIGAVFDNRYVYFVPYFNGSNHHGEVLRYDTMGNWEENPDPQDPYSQGDQSDVSGTSNDPVNTATGSFFHQQTDLSITGRGSPLIFKRYYNSKAAVRKSSKSGHVMENNSPSTRSPHENSANDIEQQAPSPLNTPPETKENSE
jgi:hypothetical protein